MSAISNVISEKKAERRQLLARAEVLAKQIADLEKENKATKAVGPKPAVKKPAAPGRKTGSKK